MKSLRHSPTRQLVSSLAIVVAVFIAFAVGGDVSQGAISAAIVLVFVVAVHVGRRRGGTLEVMSGIGDERTKALYTRAVAIAGT